MKQELNKDIYETVMEFQEKTLKLVPPMSSMLEEMKLMNFKIRPIVGNITGVDFKNEELIGTIWSMGKLEEFVMQNSEELSKKDEKIFFNLVRNIRRSLETKLSSVRLSQGKTQDVSSPFFEAEIFKDKYLVN